jgi:release factor glutamine methyltransferase
MASLESDASSLVAEAAKTLAAAGVEEPTLEAERLLEHVTGVPFLRRRIGMAQKPTPDALVRFRDLVQQRARRIPLQHLIGTAPFLQLTLEVSRHVLVPRPETEQLALLAQKLLADIPNARVADLGTGSGCLALHLAASRADLRIHAFDLSPEALDVARTNATHLGLLDRVTFHLQDAFGPDADLTAHAPFDLIVTNPPYIPDGEIPSLMPEVRDHDPILALAGGPDGLAPYRTLANRAHRWLRPSGWLLAEFGDGQSPELARIFRTPDWDHISFEKDLSGRDRILIVRPSRFEAPVNPLRPARDDVPDRSHHGQFPD